MAKKIFTDESLATLISEIKAYTDSAASTKSDSGHNHDDRYYTESEINTKVDTLNAAIDGKAPSSHTHAISEVTNLQTSLDAKVPTNRTINGKALSSNITLSASDVSAYSKSEIDDMEFITVADIDAICGGSVIAARGVKF